MASRSGTRLENLKIGRSPTILATSSKDGKRMFHLSSNGTRIRYNKDCNSKLTSNERLKVTCHEQGHALGLDHRDNQSSCMQPANIHDRSAQPDSHDYGELANLYGHRD